MARDWREVRAEADLDQGRVREHEERMLAEVRAERVRELAERVRVDYAEALRRLGE